MEKYYGVYINKLNGWHSVYALRENAENQARIRNKYDSSMGYEVREIVDYEYSLSKTQIRTSDSVGFMFITELTEPLKAGNIVRMKKTGEDYEVIGPYGVSNKKFIIQRVGSKDNSCYYIHEDQVEKIKIKAD